MWRCAILAMLACTYLGCSRNPSPYGNGRTWVKGTVDAFTVHYVQQPGGEILYAFIAHPDLSVVSSNDEAMPPSPTGVHWLVNAPDGLWIHGRKATWSANEPVFAIRKDGSLHALDWDLRQHPIGPGTGFTNPSFVEQVVFPALDMPVASP